jgi:ubiquinone/menaquinone biosynthesis C-methylase UbiE
MTHQSLPDIESLSYVDFMSELAEINRPPGGRDSIRALIQSTYLNKDSLALDVGCNTGYCAFEISMTAKCHVIGLDLSTNMIRNAIDLRDKYFAPYKERLHFLTGDALSLPFDTGTFDLVMSGGSTVFVPSIVEALIEYRRVTKDWGFVCDINFYYHSSPPPKLIAEMNALMDISIQPWEIDYWLDLYAQLDLEMYDLKLGKMQHVTRDKVLSYCERLVSQRNWPKSIHNLAVQRLIDIMSLFNENHRYLGYGVFIMRKRTFPEISLF